MSRFRAWWLVLAVLPTLVSCGREQNVRASGNVPSEGSAVSVGVVTAGPADLSRELTVSSELVPYQEIDVYAKEAGYVRQLNVDYGSHVKKDQVMAVLEIPELQAQLRQDDAAIRSNRDMITHAEKELSRIEAQRDVAHGYAQRLSSVNKQKPGLVAQQEIDDAVGKDLAAEAQVEAARANLQSAQSELLQTQARKEHDQVLFDYAKITAPFAGVVTQRYANFGTLMQAGTGSSTQAMPLVKLSEDDLFRLVIPVPENYVRYIHMGDPVAVTVPSLNKTFPGTVKRFSEGLREDTRTMHTEVDVPNPGRILMPGLYADATITLERRNNALSIPLQGLDRNAGRTTVMTVDAANKVQVRPVTIGIENDRLAEITSGISPGDKVIVSDRSGLKAGQSVRPQEIQPIQYQSQEDR